MKRIVLVATTGLALCAGTMTAGANGCCFWPFWAFGLGIGLGAAVTAASTPKYVYPVYSYPYAPPAYSYYYPPHPVYTHPASIAPAATAPELDYQAHSWVPSTPGAGRWVPDPQPYRYVQSNESQPVKPLSQVYPMTVSTFSTVSSPGGVPVHVIQ